MQPYKAELLPHWRFKSPSIAQESADTLFDKFVAYRDAADFVGMDMARKFLQMGFTRSRRYANHRTGIKRKDGQALPLDHDPVKAECAEVFKAKLETVKADAVYVAAKAEHLKLEAQTTESLSN